MRVVWYGLVSALVLLGACGTTRSILVPMALNPISTPSRGRAQLRERATAGTLVVPSEQRGHLAQYLARVQLDTELAIRASRYFTLRLHGGTFLAAGAQRVNAGDGVGPGDDAGPARAGYVFGGTPTLTVPLDHARTLLTLETQLGFAFLPMVWVPEYTCDEGPEEPYFCSGAEEQTTTFGIVAGVGIGAFRWIDRRLRVGGVVAVRGQPTANHAFDAPPPTAFGHVAIVLSAEAQLQLSEAVFVAFETQWIGVIGPYTVLPSFGLTIGGKLGDGPGQDPAIRAR